MIQSPRRMDGMVVFVTGASAGIGFATAQRFASAGATVVMCARGKQMLEDAAESIRTEGGTVATVPLDVGDHEGFARELRFSAEKFGRLDILVNNAASYGIRSIQNETIATWRDRFSSNIDSVFVGTREAVHLMRSSGKGAIINVSSIYGTRAQAGLASYSTTKAAIIQFTAVAAMEAARLGIRINSIVPGIIDTPLVRKSIGEANMPGLEEKISSGIPLGRMGRSVEVANVIFFLASDEASYVTGSCIAVDGGKGAQYPSSV